MKRLVLALLLGLTINSLALADEAKKENTKHWLVGIGPAFSTSLIGTGGTKFNMTLGYDQGLSERLDLLYFYDAAGNTSSMGSTIVTEIGAAIDAYQGDRGADTSAFIRLDLGYGGNNRYVDASPMGGIGLGIEFFRTRESTFQALYRHNTTLTQATTSLGAYPSVDELDIALMF